MRVEFNWTVQECIVLRVVFFLLPYQYVLSLNKQIGIVSSTECARVISGRMIRNQRNRTNWEILKQSEQQIPIDPCKLCQERNSVCSNNGTFVSATEGKYQVFHISSQNTVD